MSINTHDPRLSQRLKATDYRRPALLWASGGKDSVNRLNVLWI